MRLDAQSWREQFSEWCFGDQSAVDFLSGFFFVVHLWDDLIDGDERAPEDINRAFFWLLVELPRNKFFATFKDFLLPVIQTYIEQWYAANILERSGDEDKIARAYGLRDTTMGLPAQSAYLLGGYDHMLKVSAEMLELATSEPLKDYKESL